MHWSADYIGLPFADRGRSRDGVDCWGLLRLVYAEVLGLDLPSYTEGYASVAERAEIAALLTGERRTALWTEVPAAAADPFDVLLFTHMGKPLHVGLVVRRGLMLHVTEGQDSRLEPYGDGWWRPRLLAAHRHARMANGAGAAA